MNADCARFEADRVLKASGEATSADFDRHAASCASCQADVAEFREIARLYHESATDRLPSAVAAAARVRSFRPFVRRAGAMAAAALVASMLWMLLLRTDKPVVQPVRPPVAVQWEETTPAGEFLIVLDLDDRIRAARKRAESLVRETSELDLEITNLKSRVAGFRVDRDRM